MADIRNTGYVNNATNVLLTDNIRTVYSPEIYWKAQPILVMHQIAETKEELMVEPGKTIQFLRFGDVENGEDDTIAEDETVKVDAMNSSSFQVTVRERVKGLGFSEVALRTYFTNHMDDVTKKLGRIYARNTDKLVGNELYRTSNVIFANGRADRSALVSSDVMNTELVDELLVSLAENKAPKNSRYGAYVAFVSPRQARALRNDPKFLQYHMYGSPEDRLNGEIGRYEGVRFVETTMIRRVQTDGKLLIDGGFVGTDFNHAGTGIASGVANIYSTNTPVDVGLIVGDNVIGHATSLPVELRDNGIEDFGRTRKLAYYTIDGVGLLEEAHVFAFETASGV
jgi:N4-gp56 family major capsid protein